MVLLVLLMVLTALAYGLMIHFRGKRSVYFANSKTLEKIHGFKHHSVSPVILLAKFLIIFLLFLVATESVQLYTTQIADNTEYLIMIDVSSSMAVTDFDPDRLSAAKEIAQQWTGKVPSNSFVSLLSYSQGIQSSVPFTNDKSLIRDSLDNLSINYLNSTTNLDASLLEAFGTFSNRTDKTVLLFTDSVDSIQTTTVSRAKNEDIRVLIFGIGSQIESLDTDFFETQSLNFTTMELLANQTNGDAFRVSSYEELSDALLVSTQRETQVALNSTFYVLILIAILSIFELVIYARFGGL